MKSHKPRMAVVKKQKFNYGDGLDVIVCDLPKMEKPKKNTVEKEFKSCWKLSKERKLKSNSKLT